jgi:hypothetical protein
VPVAVGVDQARSAKPGDRLLIGQRSWGRSRSEGVAGRLPGAVGAAFEIGEHDAVWNLFGPSFRIGGIESEGRAVEVADEVLATGTAIGQAAAVDDHDPLLRR